MNSDDFITKTNCNNFTLTVKAVNDAPIMLQPIGTFKILGDQWVAAVVLSIVFGNNSNLNFCNNFTPVSYTHLTLPTNREV